MLEKRIIGALIGIITSIAVVLSGCGNVNEEIAQSAGKLETV